MGQPKVLIIIVNWNGAKYLPDCLNSVYNQVYPNYEVVLVDNASTDGSVKYVRENFPQVKVILLDNNLGFVGGTNAGISYALSTEADYVVLLNNDTKVNSTWLQELVRTANSDSSIGICFSKILMLDEPEIINSAGGECDIWGFPRDRGFLEYDKGQYDRVEEVFEGCGASMLIRREVIENVGTLDLRFFMYDEDTDLAWRARLYGYKVVYVPSSVVYHKFGGTGGAANPQRRYLAVRNMLRSILKNAGTCLLLEMLSRFFIIKTAGIILFLITGRVKVSIGLLKAILWNVRYLPETLVERKKIQESRKVPDKKVKNLLVKRSLEVEMFRQGYLSKFKPDFRAKFWGKG